MPSVFLVMKTEEHHRQICLRAKSHCCGSRWDRVNFHSSQKGSWLGPGGNSIVPHVIFGGEGKGSLSGVKVWPRGGMLSGVSKWWAPAGELFTS